MTIGFFILLTIYSVARVIVARSAALGPQSFVRLSCIITGVAASRGVKI